MMYGNEYERSVIRMLKITFERGTFQGFPYWELLCYDHSINQEELNYMVKKMIYVPDYFWFKAPKRDIYEKIRELWNLNIKSEEFVIEV
jgi:hypothetical protein